MLCSSVSVNSYTGWGFLNVTKQYIIATLRATCYDIATRGIICQTMFSIQSYTLNYTWSMHFHTWTNFIAVIKQRIIVNYL